MRHELRSEAPTRHVFDSCGRKLRKKRERESTIAPGRGEGGRGTVRRGGARKRTCENRRYVSRKFNGHFVVARAVRSRPVFRPENLSPSFSPREPSGKFRVSTRGWETAASASAASRPRARNARNEAHARREEHARALVRNGRRLLLPCLAPRGNLLFRDVSIIFFSMLSNQIRRSGSLPFHLCFVIVFPR